jgi:cytosine/adenosine deaminase-related metal-dependent hydrolase
MFASARRSRVAAFNRAAAVLLMVVSAVPRLPPNAQGPAILDVVLIGGRALDPETNLDAVRHVGIRGGRIVSVGTTIPRARDTVSIRGLVVAPGFIDPHAHRQDSLNYELLARDGVTTALELELGTYPIAPWYAKRAGKTLINFGVAAGHIHARRTVLEADSSAEGDDVINATGAFVRSPIARDRLPELERRLDVALAEGALGVGMGINYTPAATREEILRAFAVAARRRAPVFAHMRFAGLLENAGGVAGTQELLANAAATGASLHIVHLTSMGLGATPTLLEMIAGARARGLDVTTEAYPYSAAATMLQSAMFDADFRERLGIDYKDVLWTATGERLSAETFESRRAQGGLVVMFMIPESAMDAALKTPHVMIGSDGGLQLQNGRPIGHPRTSGSHARVVGHFVRERGLFSLMDAVRKMTLLPARRLETIAPDMKRKGRLQAGADADIVVFDPERVIDRSTFERPAEPSQGIVHVIVNGTFVVRQGNLIPAVRPGLAVRGRR